MQVVDRRFDAREHCLSDFLTRVAKPHGWLEAGSEEFQHGGAPQVDGTHTAA